MLEVGDLVKFRRPSQIENFHFMSANVQDFIVRNECKIQEIVEKKQVSQRLIAYRLSCTNDYWFYENELTLLKRTERNDEKQDDEFVSLLF